jgi:hypothetical protein
MNRKIYLGVLLIAVVFLMSEAEALSCSRCECGNCYSAGSTKWITIYDKKIGGSSYPDGGRYCIGNSVAQNFKDYDVYEKREDEQKCNGPFQGTIPPCACYWGDTGNSNIFTYEKFTGTSTVTQPCPADYSCCLGNDLADCTYSCVAGSCFLSKTATGTCPTGQHCEGGECKDDVPEFPAGVTAVFGTSMLMFFMMRRKYVRK